MKRPNITPGEWTACIGHAGERFNIECRGTHNDLDPVATCKGSDRKANAKTIAALPDLLAALEDAYSLLRELHFQAIDGCHETEAQVKTALTKAGYEFP